MKKMIMNNVGLGNFGINFRILTMANFMLKRGYSMSEKFNNITLEKAKDIITKEYFLEQSILRKKGMPNPIIVSITFTIALLLVSLVSALNGNQITNISTYAWIFIIPINFLPLFLKLIIKNKYLTLYKNSLSMYSIFSYMGFLLVIVLIVFTSHSLLGKKNMGIFFLFLLSIVLMLWVIVYTFKIILSDVYSKYGLSVPKTKFSLWYRKAFIGVLTAGIGLAYLFRNLPGSHGSTAPQ